MRKYLAIAKATWQEYFAYKTNFFLELIGGIFNTIIMVTVWMAIFRDHETGGIGGFTLPQMVTYLLGVGIINSFILLTSQGDEINDDINRGDLSNFLVKPMNIPLYWLTRDCCRRGFTFLLGVAEYLFLLIGFSHFLVPPSPVFLFWTILTMLLAGILHFVLFYIFSIIAFWMNETWGFRFVMRVFMTIATGAVIPISLFPPLWKAIFEILPFKYFAFVPMQIYLGKFSPQQIIQELSIELLWIFFALGISVWIWRKGLKRYSAYGH